MQVTRDKPLDQRDYFTDYEILKDPYGYFEALREHGPVYKLPGRNIVVVTGFQETNEVLRNTKDFSSVSSVQGAAAPLPFEPEGDDIAEDVEAHRSQIHGGELLVALDDARHRNMRALISRLFTPSRLAANEKFMAEYADELVRTTVARGDCEMVKEVATPFVTLVIADLLGVPADDRQLFMEWIDNAPPAGALDGANAHSPDNPLIKMGKYFGQYFQERRKNPRDDIMTEFAHASFPDGSKPDLNDLVQLAGFMFGAGQDTSAKLLTNSIRHIVDEPGLQGRLRADLSLVPALIEEVLRIEGSSKQTCRLARRSTRIGDVEVPAGTQVMLALAAANRDPRRWENPHDVVLDRSNIREHLAFGRGGHTCAGAPLARAEVRIILTKYLEQTSNIDLNETVHGPHGSRSLDYEPSFIIRGLSELHVKLTP